MELLWNYFGTKMEILWKENGNFTTIFWLVPPNSEPASNGERPFTAFILYIPFTYSI